MECSEIANTGPVETMEIKKKQKNKKDKKKIIKWKKNYFESRTLILMEDADE